MNTRGGKRAVKRLVVALLLTGGLGGCVYDPYYSGYAYPAYGYSTYVYPAYGYSTYAYPGYAYRAYGYRGYGWGYGYPAYVGPPVSLNFGFYEHRHHGGYYGKHHGHGWRGHGHGHGWRGHGGGHHGSGYRGGWGHRGGRH